MEEFVIELEHPEFSAEITEESGLAKQTYRICYNSEFFYFNFGKTLPKGSHLYLKLADNSPVTSTAFGTIRAVKM